MGLNPESPHCDSTAWTPQLSNLYINEASFILVTPEENLWSWSPFDEIETHITVFCWFHVHRNSQPKFCDFSLLVSITFCLNVNTVLIYISQIFNTNDIALWQSLYHLYTVEMNYRQWHDTHCYWQKWYFVVTFVCSSDQKIWEYRGK